MKKRTLNIIQGIGSVLDIYPGTDYSEYVPEITRAPQTGADNFHNAWIRVGDALRHAMSVADVEKKNKTAKSKLNSLTTTTSVPSVKAGAELQQASLSTRQMRLSIHSGPLPDPTILHEYEVIRPGFV
ncbi:MAG: hypothetical protein HQK97_04680 [Nitrospirae bacterium]|nr:hypothetical protein [Nitrospirota bacterium]